MSQDGPTCEVCAVGVSYPQGFFVTIESDSVEIWKPFCTWEHVREWVGRGEPEFERSPYEESLGDNALKYGCLLVGLLLAGLMLVGAGAVVRTVV